MENNLATALLPVVKHHTCVTPSRSFLSHCSGAAQLQLLEEANKYANTEGPKLKAKD